jgi:hypothetical protein
MTVRTNYLVLLLLYSNQWSFTPPLAERQRYVYSVYLMCTSVLCYCMYNTRQTGGGILGRNWDKKLKTFKRLGGHSFCIFIFLLQFIQFLRGV